MQAYEGGMVVPTDGGACGVPKLDRARRGGRFGSTSSYCRSLYRRGEEPGAEPSRPTYRGPVGDNDGNGSPWGA